MSTTMIAVDGVAALPIAWVLALVINLMPALAPPTWAVLAIVRETTAAPLLPLTIGGAAASALGRTGLALGTRKLSGRLPQQDQKNAQALGDFLQRHQRWTVAIVFFGCLGPMPSNALFIAVGLGRVQLKPVVIAFFVSRCIADTVWVATAGAIAGGLSSVFREQLTSWQGITLQLAGLFAAIGVLRLPWGKWLRIGPKPGSAAGPGAERPQSPGHTGEIP